MVWGKYCKSPCSGLLGHCSSRLVWARRAGVTVVSIKKTLIPHKLFRFLQSDTYKANKAANRITVTEFGTVAFPDPCGSIFGVSLIALP